MIQNIPFELQRLPQWVCAGENKLPINPHTGAAADVTDPATWGTFLEACSCNMKHIGFVLSKNDPYSIIDLDDPRKNSKGEWETDTELVKARTQRHCKILELFESYAEYSQSGFGIHIVVKGKIPKGCRRDRVEVYSDSRYMICTGKPYNTLPITGQQPLLDRLFAEMSTGAKEEVELVQVEGVLKDEEIFSMACTAANAEKFTALWNGNFQNNPLYPSQSEADFALISMLCFYSKDNEQVRRMFRASALGQREKATRNNKYLDYALRKIRANEIPTANIDKLLSKAKNMLAKQKPSAVALVSGEKDGSQGEPEPVCAGVNTTGSGSFVYPPGFVGELAKHFEATAIRPVKEIALVSAIALCAGVLGRSYNISNTGLNQYIILIANTGTGKEGISSAIESIVSTVRAQVPGANEFIGPSIFASGQAMVRVLDKQNCFVSVLGEFGLTLQTICDPKANTAAIMLKRILLDLYAKSGFHNVLRPSVYSDVEKNTNMVQAPNLTIVGESTPSTFYDKLDLSHIAEGLIPRFCVVEYTGPRPPANDHAGLPAPKELVDKFAELVAIALTTAQNRTFCPVQVDAEAKRMLKEFDRFCDDKINAATAEVDRHLWNRAHLKVLKLAALVAVGCNPHEPIVTGNIAQWALQFIFEEVSNMAKRFKHGQVGNGSGRQDSDLRRCIEDYLRMSVAQKVSYDVKPDVAQAGIITFGFLRRRALRLASFTDDRRGVDSALESLLKAMCNAGIIVQLPPAELILKYNMRTPAYLVGEAWHQSGTA